MFAEVCAVCKRPACPTRTDGGDTETDAGSEAALLSEAPAHLWGSTVTLKGTWISGNVWCKLQSNH